MEQSQRLQEIHSLRGKKLKISLITRSEKKVLHEDVVQCKTYQRPIFCRRLTTNYSKNNKKSADDELSLLEKINDSTENAIDFLLSIEQKQRKELFVSVSRLTGFTVFSHLAASFYFKNSPNIKNMDFILLSSFEKTFVELFIEAFNLINDVELNFLLKTLVNKELFHPLLESILVIINNSTEKDQVSLINSEELLMIISEKLNFLSKKQSILNSKNTDDIAKSIASNVKIFNILYESYSSVSSSDNTKLVKVRDEKLENIITNSRLKNLLNVLKTNNISKVVAKINDKNQDFPYTFIEIYKCFFFNKIKQSTMFIENSYTLKDWETIITTLQSQQILSDNNWNLLDSIISKLQENRKLNYSEKNKNNLEKVIVENKQSTESLVLFLHYLTDNHPNLIFLNYNLVSKTNPLISLLKVVQNSDTATKKLFETVFDKIIPLILKKKEYFTLLKNDKFQNNFFYYYFLYLAENNNTEKILNLLKTENALRRYCSKSMLNSLLFDIPKTPKYLKNEYIKLLKTLKVFDISNSFWSLLKVLKSKFIDNSNDTIINKTNDESINTNDSVIVKHSSLSQLLSQVVKLTNVLKYSNSMSATYKSEVFENLINSGLDEKAKEQTSTYKNLFLLKNKTKNNTDFIRILVIIKNHINSLIDFLVQSDFLKSSFDQVILTVNYLLEMISFSNSKKVSYKTRLSQGYIDFNNVSSKNNILVKILSANIPSKDFLKLIKVFNIHGLELIKLLNQVFSKSQNVNLLLEYVSTLSQTHIAEININNRDSLMYYEYNVVKSTVIIITTCNNNNISSVLFYLMRLYLFIITSYFQQDFNNFFDQVFREIKIFNCKNKNIYGKIDVYNQIVNNYNSKIKNKIIEEKVVRKLKTKIDLYTIANTISKDSLKNAIIAYAVINGFITTDISSVINRLINIDNNDNTNDLTNNNNMNTNELLTKLNEMFVKKVAEISSLKESSYLNSGTSTIINEITSLPVSSTIENSNSEFMFFYSHKYFLSSNISEQFVLDLSETNKLANSLFLKTLLVSYLTKFSNVSKFKLFKLLISIEYWLLNYSKNEKIKADYDNLVKFNYEKQIFLLSMKNTLSIFDSNLSKMINNIATLEQVYTNALNKNSNTSNFNNELLLNLNGVFVNLAVSDKKEDRNNIDSNSTYTNNTTTLENNIKYCLDYILSSDIIKISKKEFFKTKYNPINFTLICQIQDRLLKQTFLKQQFYDYCVITNSYPNNINDFIDKFILLRVLIQATTIKSSNNKCNSKINNYSINDIFNYGYGFILPSNKLSTINNSINMITPLFNTISIENSKYNRYLNLVCINLLDNYMFFKKVSSNNVNIPQSSQTEKYLCSNLVNVLKNISFFNELLNKEFKDQQSLEHVFISNLIANTLNNYLKTNSKCINPNNSQNELSITDELINLFISSKMLNNPQILLAVVKIMSTYTLIGLNNVKTIELIKIVSINTTRFICVADEKNGSNSRSNQRNADNSSNNYIQNLKLSLAERKWVFSSIVSILGKLYDTSHLEKYLENIFVENYVVSINLINAYEEIKVLFVLFILFKCKANMTNLNNLEDEKMIKMLEKLAKSSNNNVELEIDSEKNFKLSNLLVQAFNKKTKVTIFNSIQNADLNNSSKNNSSLINLKHNFNEFLKEVSSKNLDSLFLIALYFDIRQVINLAKDCFNSTDSRILETVTAINTPKLLSILIMKNSNNNSQNYFKSIEEFIENTNFRNCFEKLIQSNTRIATEILLNKNNIKEFSQEEIFNRIKFLKAYNNTEIKVTKDDICTCLLRNCLNSELYAEGFKYFFSSKHQREEELISCLIKNKLIIKECFSFSYLNQFTTWLFSSSLSSKTDRTFSRGEYDEDDSFKLVEVLKKLNIEKDECDDPNSSDLDNIAILKHYLDVICEAKNLELYLYFTHYCPDFGIYSLNNNFTVNMASIVKMKNSWIKRMFLECGIKEEHEELSKNISSTDCFTTIVTVSNNSKARFKTNIIPTKEYKEQLAKEGKEREERERKAKPDKTKLMNDRIDVFVKKHFKLLLYEEVLIEKIEMAFKIAYCVSLFDKFAVNSDTVFLFFLNINTIFSKYREETENDYSEVLETVLLLAQNPVSPDSYKLLFFILINVIGFPITPSFIKCLLGASNSIKGSEFMYEDDSSYKKYCRLKESHIIFIFYCLSKKGIDVFNLSQYKNNLSKNIEDNNNHSYQNTTNDVNISSDTNTRELIVMINSAEKLFITYSHITDENNLNSLFNINKSNSNNKSCSVDKIVSTINSSKSLILFNLINCSYLHLFTLVVDLLDLTNEKTNNLEFLEGITSDEYSIKINDDDFAILSENLKLKFLSHLFRVVSDKIIIKEFLNSSTSNSLNNTSHVLNKNKNPDGNPFTLIPALSYFKLTSTSFLNRLNQKQENKELIEEVKEKEADVNNIYDEYNSEDLIRDQLDLLLLANNISHPVIKFIYSLMTKMVNNESQLESTQRLIYQDSTLRKYLASRMNIRYLSGSLIKYICNNQFINIFSFYKNRLNTLIGELIFSLRLISSRKDENINTDMFHIDRNNYFDIEFLCMFMYKAVLTNYISKKTKKELVYYYPYFEISDIQFLVDFISVVYVELASQYKNNTINSAKDNNEKNKGNGVNYLLERTIISSENIKLIYNDIDLKQYISKYENDNEVEHTNNNQVNSNNNIILTPTLLTEFVNIFDSLLNIFYHFNQYDKCHRRNRHNDYYSSIRRKLFDLKLINPDWNFFWNTNKKLFSLFSFNPILTTIEDFNQNKYYKNIKTDLQNSVVRFFFETKYDLEITKVKYDLHFFVSDSKFYVLIPDDNNTKSNNVTFEPCLLDEFIKQIYDFLNQTIDRFFEYCKMTSNEVFSDLIFSHPELFINNFTEISNITNNTKNTSSNICNLKYFDQNFKLYRTFGSAPTIYLQFINVKRKNILNETDESLILLYHIININLFKQSNKIAHFSWENFNKEKNKAFIEFKNLLLKLVVNDKNEYLLMKELDVLYQDRIKAYKFSVEDEEFDYYIQDINNRSDTIKRKIKNEKDNFDLKASLIDNLIRLNPSIKELVEELINLSELNEVNNFSHDMSNNNNISSNFNFNENFVDFQFNSDNNSLIINFNDLKFNKKLGILKKIINNKLKTIILAITYQQNNFTIDSLIKKGIVKKDEEDLFSELLNTTVVYDFSEITKSLQSSITSLNFSVSNKSISYNSNEIKILENLCYKAIRIYESYDELLKSHAYFNFNLIEKINNLKEKKGDLSKSKLKLILGYDNLLMKLFIKDLFLDDN